MFFQATMPMPQNLQDWESSPSDKFNKLHKSVYFDNTTGMTMFFSNLDIPIPDLDKIFSFGVWIEVGIEAFRSITKGETSCTGTLISKLHAFYEDSVGLPVECLFDLSSVDFYVPKAFVVDKESRLYFDQKNGLSLEDYHKWQKKLLG